MWLCAQNQPAAGALCTRPRQKKFAFIAALVAVAIMTSMLFPGGFILRAEPPARHVQVLSR
ncbi:MAG TPA: hypothetical protein VJP79_07445 [Nitrososphaera sp.]|nr:hypothetical protein [Nitrososphaera sp.]